MDELTLDFKGITLSPQKEAVRVFYKELWGHADKERRNLPLVPELKNTQAESQPAAPSGQRF